MSNLTHGKTFVSMNKISAEVFLGPFVSRAFQKNKSSEELHSLSDINYFGIRQTALVKSAVHSRTDVNIQYIQKKKKEDVTLQVKHFPEVEVFLALVFHFQTYRKT